VTFQLLNSVRSEKWGTGEEGKKEKNYEIFYEKKHNILITE
jgi:hypothetical protein